MLSPRSGTALRKSQLFETDTDSELHSLCQTVRHTIVRTLLAFVTKYPVNPPVDIPEITFAIIIRFLL